MAQTVDERGRNPWMAQPIAEPVGGATHGPRNLWRDPWKAQLTVHPMDDKTNGATCGSRSPRRAIW
eukprot:957430-Pyramimonas_sp.AAC.1